MNISHPASRVLVFLPQNWNVPQTVSVTAIFDLIDEGSHVSTAVRHNLSSSDSQYVLRLFPLCALISHAQGSSGAVATVQFCMARPYKEPHHSGQAEP